MNLYEEELWGREGWRLQWDKLMGKENWYCQTVKEMSLFASQTIIRRTLNREQVRLISPLRVGCLRIISLQTYILYFLLSVLLLLHVTSFPIFRLAQPEYRKPALKRILKEYWKTALKRTLKTKLTLFSICRIIWIFVESYPKLALCSVERKLYHATCWMITWPWSVPRRKYCAHFPSMAANLKLVLWSANQTSIQPLCL